MPLLPLLEYAVPSTDWIQSFFPFWLQSLATKTGSLNLLVESISNLLLKSVKNLSRNRCIFYININEIACMGCSLYCPESRAPQCRFCPKMPQYRTAIAPRDPRDVALGGVLVIIIPFNGKLRLEMQNSLNDAQKVLESANRIILGKENELKLFLCGVLAGGHLLIEDLPGMGKTTLVKGFARLLGLKSTRIQFTSDLLPADVLGVSIFKNEEFIFKEGPIFSNLVLGDELNRASPRTQSACLQAMEEGQITVDGTTHALPLPFIFVGTQNPQSFIGTFPLPESQLDRFLMRIELGFPNEDSEKKLLINGDHSNPIEALTPILNPSRLIQIQADIKSTHASDALVNYTLALIRASRTANQGLSPRAGMALLRASKSWAFLEGRNFVIPEDVQAVASVVLSHRLDHEQTNKRGREIVQELVDRVPLQL